MAKKHSKGPRRRANSPARGRHPKRAEEGPKERVKRYDNNNRERLMEERRNPCERWSQSRKSANFAIEGLEKKCPCARHPLHVADRRRQMVPEEGHLVKPAWAATATRGRRGRLNRPIRQGRARGGEEGAPRPTPSSARGTHTESSPEAKTTECGTLRATEPTGRPKDDKNPPRGRAGKNAPKSPTVGIPSLEIRSLDPDPKRVTPS